MSSALSIDVVPLEPLQTNAIILACDDCCAVVDPGWPEPIVDILKERQLVVTQIWLTHGHGDHIGGVNAVKAAFGDAQLIAPADDVAMLSDPRLNMSAMFGASLTTPVPDRLVTAGDVLELGATRWQVIDTSGHTPGGISFYCPQAGEAGVLLAGDALFAGSIGRTDIPGGDHDQLVSNIRLRLLALPPDTLVIPGHGPDTTIGRERAGNPFL
jgi:glyoxylase-like metal-dependent hydrolase (beta-lactamase superfamily II)